MLHIQGLVKTFTGPKSASRRRGKAGFEADGVKPRANAIDDVTLDVEDGELCTLLGPSGCGKTTTLRSVAGLEEPNRGRIALDDRVLFSNDGTGGKRINLSANERGFGMVFQSYAIWPHMSVFDNAAFPLQAMKRGRRLSKKEIADKVMQVLEVMELAGYANRPSTKLSGGQQQRLALARAIVTEPPLLLLDEPLSNLDAKLRESLRSELKRLQQDLGITSIYVTHDQTEALALSSRIAVMEEGRVVQVGKPLEIYQHPNCRFVAEFIGNANFIPGTVKTRTGQDYVIDTAEGLLFVEGVASVAADVGSRVVISIRPEAVELTGESAAGSTRNEWRGRVTTRTFLGEFVEYTVAVGNYEFRNRSTPSTSMDVGTEIYLRMDPSRLSLVPLD